MLWALGGALVSAGGMAGLVGSLGLAGAGRRGLPVLSGGPCGRSVFLPSWNSGRKIFCDWAWSRRFPGVATTLKSGPKACAGNLAAAELAVERRQRWAGLADRRAELEADAEELEAWRSGLAARLGAAPDADEASLLALVEGLRRWQDARNLAAEIAAVIEALEAEWSQDLALLNGHLG